MAAVPESDDSNKEAVHALRDSYGPEVDGRGLEVDGSGIEHVQHPPLPIEPVSFWRRYRLYVSIALGILVVGAAVGGGVGGTVGRSHRQQPASESEPVTTVTTVTQSAR